MFGGGGNGAGRENVDVCRRRPRFQTQYDGRANPHKNIPVMNVGSPRVV